MTCTASSTARPVAEYFIGDELGPLQVWWIEEDDLINFSVAHTFTGKLIVNGDVLFTTTTGFSGAVGAGTEDDGTPNLVKAWPISGELNDLGASGPYIFQVTAVRTVDSRERTFQVVLNMKRRY